LDGTYFRGLRTTVDGKKGDNEQETMRTGFTVALPIDRQNSIKLNAGTGIYTRTGSQFSNVGIATRPGPNALFLQQTRLLQFDRYEREIPFSRRKTGSPIGLGLVGAYRLLRPGISGSDAAG